MGLDNLLVQLGVNTKAYDAGFEKAGKTAEKFGSKLKGQLAAAFGAAAIGAWVKQVADAVGTWKDVSEQFGITTDEAQQLEEQAKKSGLSLEDVTGALAKLNQARRAALEGDEKSVKAFNLLGVAFRDLASNKSGVDLLKQIGLSVKVLGVDGAKAAAMMDILGKQGKRFQGVLKDINNTGVNLVSEENIERIDDMIKKLEVIKNTALAVTATAFGKMLGGDFSDIKSIIGKVFTPQAGNPFFDLPVTPGIAVMKAGKALAQATFPSSNLVSSPGLPIPTSAAANAAQTKNDMEVIRIMKETKDLQKRTVDLLDKISKTGALSSF